MARGGTLSPGPTGETVRSGPGPLHGATYGGEGHTPGATEGVKETREMGEGTGT